MDSKKKDLEIVVNVQWKNKPAGDRGNIIGMYDVPTTTLNWEIFKSYLYKNSGTTGDDVRVSYITSNGQEFPIESQTDFQIALYAFRRKARNNEIVNLRLDRLSDKSARSSKHTRYSTDVETQIDNNDMPSFASTTHTADAPPEWFIDYMTKFKKDVLEEVTGSVATMISNMKPQAVTQPLCYHSRKYKVESSKRSRKHHHILGEINNEKELLRSLKREQKLESKLEKLEHKTRKIKEKKMALFRKSSDSDVGHEQSRNHAENEPSSSGATAQTRSHAEPINLSRKVQDIENRNHEMDAHPVKVEKLIPHMMGGEVYMQRWEVVNSGKAPWTSKTKLQFTWGSRALRPLENVVSVPPLEPGEQGSISVCLQIPNEPGLYEGYWHFHHEGRRFGHWLGCRVMVDSYDTEGNASILEMSDFSSTPKKFKEMDNSLPSKNIVTYKEMMLPDKLEDVNVMQKSPTSTQEPINQLESMKYNLDEVVRNVSCLQLNEPTDTNCSSDSDNQSIVSLSLSNSSKGSHEEFVLVPVPDCFKVDRSPDIAPSKTNCYGIKSCELYVEWPKTPGSREQLDAEQKQGEAKESDESKASPVEEKLDMAADGRKNSSGNAHKTSSESISKVDELPSTDVSETSDIVHVSISDEQKNAGFVQIMVCGQKVIVPKEIVKPEFLETAEDAIKSEARASSSTINSTSFHKVEEEEAGNVASKETNVVKPTEDSTIPTEANVQAAPETQSGGNNEAGYMSHCSAAGSSFSDVNSIIIDKNSRLFVFPQTCAGYEVVCPAPLEAPADPLTTDGINTSTQREAPSAYSSAVPNFVPCNDQYDPYGPLEEPAVPTAPLRPSSATPQNTGNPFAETQFVPNYQQTEPHLRQRPSARVSPDLTGNIQEPQVNVSMNHGMNRMNHGRTHENAAVHILPETLVSGAVNVASSAINTARSVINMIVPREPGRWVNGHWVSSNPETPREANLRALAEMGFWDRDLNATLLARYNDDLTRVVSELVQ